MGDSVRISSDGEVTIITLDRPEVRNAVDRSTAKALADAFEAFDEDETQKIAVFYGANGTFCAGADLKAMFASGQRESNAVRDIDAVDMAAHDKSGPMGPSRMTLSKPVVGAISGYAVAGGMELALWCDMRVVEEDAILGIFCRRWGVPLVDGGSVRLPRLIGHARAMDLILTGRPVNAEEALMMGLANRVVPRGKALDEALLLAKSIAEHPQVCMNNDRRSAIEQWDLAFGAAMANETRLGLETLASPQTKEGVTRFVGGAGRGGKFE